MRRREFIAGLSGAVAVLDPVRAWGQRTNQVRWIGVLLINSEDDAAARDGVIVFENQLKQSGWVVGGNLAIDYRWGVSDGRRARDAVGQLLRLTPDVILANGGPALTAAQQATGTVPIVFFGVSEPVERGFVASLPRPGGNSTGLTNLEATVGGKWLALLKEVAPQLSTIGLLFNPASSFAQNVVAATKISSQTLGIQVIPIHVADSATISASLTELGSKSNTGFMLPPDGFTAAYRRQIVEMAARYKLPGISSGNSFAKEGGLMSYGVEQMYSYGRVAAFVDRILRGERPADLPVEVPTKYELVINLKTAKIFGLTVPPTLLARADEVIE